MHAQYLPDPFPYMVLLGIGAGLAFRSLMTLAMSTATPEDSGQVSGLVNTVGGAVGLAVLATLSATHASRPARAGAPYR